MNAVEALGTRVVSVGEWDGEQQVQYFRKESSVYRKLVFSGGRLTDSCWPGIFGEPVF